MMKVSDMKLRAQAVVLPNSAFTLECNATSQLRYNVAELWRSSSATITLLLRYCSAAVAQLLHNCIVAVALLRRRIASELYRNCSIAVAPQ